MEKYKNEKYLKKEIMEQSRHQLIYGYCGDTRSQFLQELDEEYPLLEDSTTPIALYMDNFGLPKVENQRNQTDGYIVGAISREYLSMSIASKILEKTLEKQNKELEERLNRLLYLINKLNRHSQVEVSSLRELLQALEEAKQFYLTNFSQYLTGTIDEISINQLSVPFLQLDMFISEFKRAMNIQSYFGILLDKKEPVALSSAQAVNNIIGRRINKDISIKLAVEPNDWDTYFDPNGQRIEVIHDYGTVELDDSHKEYIKTLIKNNE